MAAARAGLARRGRRAAGLDAPPACRRRCLLDRVRAPGVRALPGRAEKHLFSRRRPHRRPRPVPAQPRGGHLRPAGAAFSGSRLPVPRQLAYEAGSPSVCRAPTAALWPLAGPSRCTPGRRPRCSWRRPGRPSGRGGPAPPWPRLPVPGGRPRTGARRRASGSPASQVQPAPGCAGRGRGPSQLLAEPPDQVLVVEARPSVRRRPCRPRPGGPPSRGPPSGATCSTRTNTPSSAARSRGPPGLPLTAQLSRHALRASAATPAEIVEAASVEHRASRRRPRRTPCCQRRWPHASPAPARAGKAAGAGRARTTPS